MRKLFREKKVEVVLAGDKLFQQYHSGTSKVLVSKGTKRICSSTKLSNTKEECTIMVDC